MQPSSRTLRHVAFSALIGMLFYGLFMLIANRVEIESAVTQLNISTWSVILGLSLANYVLRFARWHGYLRALGYQIPLALDCTHYFSGFAFTVTPGKAGEAVRSIYLEKQGVRYRDSLAVFVTERVLDLLVITALSTLVAAQFIDSVWLIAVGASVLIALLIVIRLAQSGKSIGKVSGTPMPLCVIVALRRLCTVLQSSSQLLLSRSVFGGLALGLVAWTLEGMAVYLIAVELGVEISLTAAVGIYAVSVLAGAFSMIPGGIGSTEAAMALLLTLFGADLSTAVAVAIVCRIATLWFAVGLGGMAVCALQLDSSPVVNSAN
jgi:uncharacterized protein (TIRG00374 family)